MNLAEKTVRKNYVFEGKIIKVRCDDAELPDGRPCRREVVEHGGGAAVLYVRGGEVLLVSQFTLYGDVRKGNRPSFTEAERPERANALYLAAAGALRGQGVPVKLGVFGAHMFIEQVNDGPVTIIYEI